MTENNAEFIITRNPRHFVQAVLQVCGVLKVLQSMPRYVRLQNNMARSSRGTDRVDYVALNNLSSADFETASKGKRKYKPGAKLYEVERLISKRKSSNKKVRLNSNEA